MNRPRRDFNPTLLMRLGMSAMLLYFGLYWLVPRVAGAEWTERLSGASGLALGVAIGLVFLSIRARRRRELSGGTGICD